MSSYVQDGEKRKEKVLIIGSGNWGSAIARIAARNVLAFPHQFEPEVTMWVYEEDVNGTPLTQIINKTHINERYLPGIYLGDNVVANPNLLKALQGATALVFVLPHQFIRKIIQDIREHVNKDVVRAVTLAKGVDVTGTAIKTFATVINEELGISCSALSGANIAQEVAQDHFCESTLGVPCPNPDFEGDVESLPDAQLWKPLFHAKSFRISVVPDVEGVSLCGALKNIIAVAAGLIDGLNWGSNAKAAIMRIGMEEIKDFSIEFFPTSQASTFLEESCGIADIIATCIGGRNRQIAEQHVKTGKTFQELEQSLLKGQKLQGPQTAFEVHEFLEERGTKRKGGYPLFEAVWKVCYEGLPPERLIDDL